MYKLSLIFVLLIFFGATALAIEPSISPTQIRDLSVQQKVNIVEKLKQIEKLAYEVSEEAKGKIGVQIQFQNDEDRLYLEDFFEIYEQVQLENTMNKVLQLPEQKPIPKVILKEEKYQFDIGYTYDPNGVTYKIINRAYLWERPIYLVVETQYGKEYVGAHKSLVPEYLITGYDEEEGRKINFKD